ncbi:MAG: L-threonylcarbamoyladenylate synthase [Oscillospiraceae bacterium]|nr:L-threonylcarbamoyladenylate synthase [Oscillospiraceae bacterium]
METIILSADNPHNIEICAESIASGDLVAIPTETVYGLAANACDASAVSKIFQTKGRQPDNPLIVHIAEPAQVERFVSDIPETFKTLSEKFWPGPLTLIMKSNGSIPDNVTAGLTTVAIRMPNHPATLALIHKSNCPIAAPSANLSGSPSPTRAIHVKHDLDGKIPYILDGGDCHVGLESTVLDISEYPPRILRPGGVTHDELTVLLGTVAIENDSTSAIDKPRSPGMKYRHYAPKAPMFALAGAPDATACYIKSQIDTDPRAAALMFDDYAIDHTHVVTFGAHHDLCVQAANLFDALRQLDALSPSQIFAQMPPATGLGYAITNRIKKASGNHIIEC